MKTLNADLKSGEFRPVYLLYGDESFLLRSYKGRFMQKVAGGDGMNTAYFEGKDINEDDVITAGDTMPFFAEHRLVVVENSGWFKGSVEKIADWIPEMPDTTVLLFVEGSVDKRNRLYKAVQKKGYLCEMKHPEHRELSVWAARYLAAAGKKITASTMDRILEYTGDDMENLRNELEKLISYVGEREVVDARDVDTVTTVTVTNRIFDMVRAITSRRTGEALRLYQDLLQLREPPMRILFLIAKQYNQMLQIRELMNAGKDKNEIARISGIPPFAASRMMGQVRSMQSAALLSQVRRCVELEEAVKTGDLQDRMAVELLITGA